MVGQWNATMIDDHRGSHLQVTDCLIRARNVDRSNDSRTKLMVNKPACNSWWINVNKPACNSWSSWLMMIQAGYRLIMSNHELVTDWWWFTMVHTTESILTTWLTVGTSGESGYGSSTGYRGGPHIGETGQVGSWSIWAPSHGHEPLNQTDPMDSNIQIESRMVVVEPQKVGMVFAWNAKSWLGQFLVAGNPGCWTTYQHITPRPSNCGSSWVTSAW